MEWTRKNVLLVVLAGVAAYVGLQNLSALAGVLGWLLDMLFPFVLGGAIAFVLNVPMRAIERDLFPRAKGMARLRRPLAYILTLVFVIGVLTLAGLVIVPGISDAFTLLRDQIPAALARAQEQLDALGALLPWLGEVIAELNIDWAELSQKALVLLRDLSGRLLSSGSGIVGDVDAVPEEQQKTIKGSVDDIRSAVLDGTSYYFIRLVGYDTYYSISAADSPEAVILNEGDQVTITYVSGEDSILTGVALEIR